MSGPYEASEKSMLVSMIDAIYRRERELVELRRQATLLRAGVHPAIPIVRAIERMVEAIALRQ